MCYNYKEEKDIEAIKKEAHTYYSQFKNQSIDINFKFISLQDDVKGNEEIYDCDLDVFYWGYEFNKLLEAQPPDIIHIFSNSLEGFHLLEKNFGEKYIITMYTITGIDPFPIYEPGYLIHLKHAIDVGNLFLFVESPISMKKLDDLGLRSVQVLPQTLMNNLPVNTKKNDVFTIGFASAPLSEEVWEDRGIELLLALAARLKQCKFKLAWRSIGLDLLRNRIEKLSLQNIEIHNGYLNMNEFYNDVDATIIPYTTMKNNHSCPLSLVESISAGIPVIITNQVGIANLIGQHHLGVVAEAEINSLCECANILIENYEHFKDNLKLSGKRLFYFDPDREHIYQKIYRQILKQDPSPSLKKWQNILLNEGKYLVMGKEELAWYYNQNEIAEKYNEDRFVNYPMRIYDKLERSAINILIEKYSTGKNLRCLDIASGDGRILRELTKFGKVTALENSSFMISVSARKLKESDKVIYIKDNLFDIDYNETFDIITIFRFIRHYDYSDRKEIYKKLKSLLKNDGIIIADFPNKQAETQLRNNLGWSAFNVYDVFWNPFEIEEELNNNGLKVLETIAIGEYLMEKEEIKDNHLPLTWVVAFSINRGEG
jgi:glycosyltransferase involved in cell wall biosynthesis/SAM-dependent methyltransferase